MVRSLQYPFHLYEYFKCLFPPAEHVTEMYDANIDMEIDAIEGESRKNYQFLQCFANFL